MNTAFPPDQPRLDKADVAQAYASWAPVYDLIFDAIMAPGRKALVNAVGQDKFVLVAGVGTGLELPLFSSSTQIIGIDLSEPMLRRAHTRVNKEKLSNVESLMLMDAAQLAFSDESFHVVAAPYVMTVLPEPERTLDEFLRILKPQGEIILVNHIGAQKGPRAQLENWLAKKSALLGWRPEFPWETIGNWITKCPSAQLIERRAIAPFGLFTLVRIRKMG